MIGRRGSLCEFPPRSLDLTPCDYFLWGYLRELVYSEPIIDVDGLEARIRTALLHIPRNMFENALGSFRDRCNKCIEVNGPIFE